MTSNLGLNLIAQGEIYERAKHDRKSQGVFYTPQWLATYVVSKTIPPGATGVAADPACGCGAFLATTKTLRPNLSLVGRDLDGEACAIAAAYFARDPSVSIRRENTLFSSDEQFDFIVTNPPWGQKSGTLSGETRLKLRNRFRTARGQFDLFSLFIERSLELLKPGGSFGMVLPEVLLLKNYPIVRKLLLTETTIEEIAKVGMAFPDATMEAVVLVGKKQAVSASHQVRVLRNVREGSSGEIQKLPQGVFLDQPRFQFNTELTAESIRAFKELRSGVTLGDLFSIHEGVHTGNVRKKLFVDAKPTGPFAKVLIAGNEVTPFSLTWKGRFIDLRPDVVDRTKGDYATLGDPTRYKERKILVRRTGDRIQACVDSKGYYCSNNFFTLHPRSPMTAAQMNEYCRLLNSPFYTWYFRQMFPQKGRAFAELKIHQLCIFPAFTTSKKGTRSMTPMRFSELENRLSLGKQSRRWISAHLSEGVTP